MDRKRSLENLSNGLNAAKKLLDLKNASLQVDLNSEVKPNQIDTFYQMLDTVASYSPPKYKKVLNESIAISNNYRSTYRNLKQHLNNNNRGPNSSEIIKTLEIVKPILPNNHKAMVEKLQQIYKIIYS
ncbi:hypothetical protein [Pseudobacteroides cellulosolvens]|uniref:Uncharacterized protein n=1 Tax=Pseudobacteroides cellulosolvens ATCC 35603 = DSM 2933 TaxID=398512 RepID=A0A0L6JMU6_9FIRM|nr:hypothetical protein [Pseudobacteroides cellulosolvens]KNY27136.1 hypothetical protein Bccel_2401 [Pseudobacteroides cellulosolvens ATCC 35603 = DSM 2933]